VSASATAHAIADAAHQVPVAADFIARVPSELLCNCHFPAIFQGIGRNFAGSKIDDRLLKPDMHH
jgi:hypothetical protein